MPASLRGQPGQRRWSGAVNAAGSALRVLVADDQAVVRMGFSAMLAAQEDMEVAGLAANGREAVRLASETRPDVVLMDIRMPVADGI